MAGKKSKRSVSKPSTEKKVKATSKPKEKASIKNKRIEQKAALSSTDARADALASQPTSASKITRPQTAVPKVVRQSRLVSSEDIAKRAYEFFERRGYIDGHDIEDWLIAEAELRNGL